MRLLLWLVGCGPRAGSGDTGASSEDTPPVGITDTGCGSASTYWTEGYGDGFWPHFLVPLLSGGIDASGGLVPVHYGLDGADYDYAPTLTVYLSEDPLLADGRFDLGYVCSISFEIASSSGAFVQADQLVGIALRPEDLLLQQDTCSAELNPRSAPFDVVDLPAVLGALEWTFAVTPEAPSGWDPAIYLGASTGDPYWPDVPGLGSTWAYETDAEFNFVTSDPLNPISETVSDGRLVPAYYLLIGPSLPVIEVGFLAKPPPLPC